MQDAKKNPWCTRLKNKPSAKCRIFILPFAGGSSGYFRTWASHFSDDFDLIAIQLPGRWERFKEPLLEDIRDMARAVNEGVANEFDRPFAIIGYSFGALIGFEWIRVLRKAGMSPVHFFTVSASAPHLPKEAHIPDDSVSDEEFVRTISTLYGGVPDAVMRDADLRSMVVPYLRSDLKALDAYRFSEENKLDLPVTSIGGIEDYATDIHRISAWRELTSGPYEVRQFSGNHFFSVGREAELISYIQAHLEDSLKRIK